MRAYSQSAGYAEQALSAIRVVHTYGMEALEVANYTKYLYRAKKIQAKIAFASSAGQSILFLIIFGFYGYAFYWGGYLRYNKVINDKTGEPYAGGSVMGIMFSVITGAF